MGIRNRNLEYELLTNENLLKAAYDAQKGKRLNLEMIDFNKHYGTYLQKIYNDIVDRTYVHGGYRYMRINDGKERVISIAKVYDRVIHRLVLNVMIPIWVNTFIHQTYACIKGRGLHQCLSDVYSDLVNDPKNTRYCLVMDVHHFYESISHTILKEIIRRTCQDSTLLWLNDCIIDSTEGDRGIPVGNAPSQFYGNLYLSPYDHFMKEDMRIPYLYRYMDNITILAKTKEQLHDAYKATKWYFDNVLHLKINDNYQIFPVKDRCIDFVGYKISPHGILLRKSILYRMFRKLNHINKFYDIESEDEFKRRFPSEYGWINHCSPKHKMYLITNIIKTMSSILSVGLIDANKPATFVDLNNGQYTHLYNYNIIEESVESESGTSEIQYRYDSVRVEYPLTANHILETLLGALYPLSVESKLRNDYEAAVLGIEPESKKEGYIAFLSERKKIKEMIDKDCNANSIPNK